MCNGWCTVSTTLRFDPASLGRRLELEGDTGESDFLVTVESPRLKQRSNLLYVDLPSLVLSA